MTKNFNYQKKVWGATKTYLSTTYLGYLRLKYTLDDLRDLDFGKVLDVGCGGGGFIKSVAHYRSDLKLYAVDISKKAISVAKKDSDGVTFRIGDVYKLPYRAKSFDAVIVEDVFEHLEDPSRSFEEIYRVLKPGGILTANIPLEGALSSLHYLMWLGGWRAKEKLAGHIQRFTLKEIRRMAKDVGLEVTDTRHTLHPLGQIVDVCWFSYLSISDKKLDVGLEEKLSDKGVLNTIKKTITAVTNAESMLFPNIPGAAVHIKFKRK